MTSHMHTPYGAPTNRLKGNPHRRYEIVSIHGLAGRNTAIRFLPESQLTPPLGISSTIHVPSRFYLVPCRELTFETVTNTPPRTVSVTSADVPLAHRGPASATGRAVRTRRWWRPSPLPAGELGKPPQSRLQEKLNCTARRTP